MYYREFARLHRLEERAWEYQSRAIADRNLPRFWRALALERAAGRRLNAIVSEMVKPILAR